MNELLYLVKIGEILLKQGNRKEFEGHLLRQLDGKLAGIRREISIYPGRIFLALDPADHACAERALGSTPGINGFVPAVKCPHRPEAILAAAERLARERVDAGKRRFKVETRRSDKSFVWSSYATSSNVGEHILEHVPGTVVDLHAPEFTVNIEIRERVYVFGDTLPGQRGLPVGSGGKGLLLLSGGIDSPVAGYLMARRGLDFSAVHFHTYPYTSDEARQKVLRLAGVLARYTGGLRVRTVSFTEVQTAIRAGAPENASTLMLRAAMMEAAHILAGRIGANGIVTGESLGQVASQTAENLRFTQSTTDLPVLRPLVGTDKEDIIALARRIGTYEISILPYEDCCVLFSPRHPVLRAHFDQTRSIYRSLGLGSPVARAIDESEIVDIPYSWGEDSRRES